MTSFFVGKNFLTADCFLSNNGGAICFCGTPGSGKSRLQNILNSFMNGFQFQATGKGITEFQNYDIVTKSFLVAEEVALDKLKTSEWKMLADLEVPMKCRIKNQQDVEIAKGTPIVITTNDSVHDIILSKVSADQNLQAVTRRWMFIRYFDTWNQAHTSIMNQGMTQVDQMFQHIYSHKNIDNQLMNTLIACALLFYEHSFASPDYIISYYKHCLYQFAQTLFGQTFLLNSTRIKSIVAFMKMAYSQNDDSSCYETQKQCGTELEKLLAKHVKWLANKELFGNQIDNIDNVLVDYCLPWYFKYLTILQQGTIQQLLNHYSMDILVDYLTAHQSKQPLYKQLLESIKFDLRGKTSLIDVAANNNPEDSLQSRIILLDEDYDIDNFLI